MVVESRRAAELAGVKINNGFAKKAIGGGMDAFTAGDVFTIPEDFTGKVYRTPIGENFAEFILVKVTNNGKESAKRLYPSFFSRNLQIVNAETGEPIGRKRNEGAPCTDYMSCATQEDGMNALRGKTIKVDNEETYDIHVYGQAPNVTKKQKFFKLSYVE